MLPLGGKFPFLGKFHPAQGNQKEIRRKSEGNQKEIRRNSGLEEKNEIQIKLKE